MVMRTTQADVLFYCYGTGVQLYSAKRQNHGVYQISIDCRLRTHESISARLIRSFQIAPFSTAALTNGYHTVRMTNWSRGTCISISYCLSSNCFHSYLSVYL